MKQRLFRSILLLTGAAVGLVLLLFLWVSCQYITQDSFASLKREANLLIVADGEGNVQVSELQRLQLADRVTLIAPDGHALYDNYADAESMENHLQREEVQKALKGGEGRSQRASETLGKNILYYAVRLPDGNVLRLSRTNDAVFQQYKIILGYFVLLALEHELPVGFFMAAAPGLQENNLGRYLGFSDDALKKTLMMDSAAVLPQAQGKGIMGMMFARAVELGQMQYPYLVGTVAPGNFPSIRNFEKNGFTVRKTITKPGGQVRLLMGKGDLPAHKS